MRHRGAPRAQRSSHVSPLVAIAAIAGLIAFLTTNRLGAADVCGGNEAIEAVFVQQMVERGKVLFPLDNGRQPMYKPPLFHWSSTVLDRLLGIRRVTAFNLRLASALYATAGGVLVMGFALARLGPEAAVMSGLVLAASYEYVSQGRLGRVDMTLTFFETLSLISFLAWLEARESNTHQRAVSHYLLAASLGLGVLAKGPVGALLPGIAICSFLALERRWTDLRGLLQPVPALVAGVLGSSWYFACFFGRHYGFLNRQLGSENFGRFFGTLGTMPPWYYARPLLLNAGPLSLLVPLTVGTALSHYWGGPAADMGIEAAEARAGTSARLFAIFWVATVVFFEIAAYKRKAYLLPLSPASALLIAWWAYCYGRPRISRLMPRVVIAACVILIVVNFFYIPWHEVRDCGAQLSLGETLRWPFEGRRASERISSRQTGSYRRAAAEVDRAVGKERTLFVYGLNEALEPLLFYLDRNTIPLAGPLDQAPSGYVIVPGAVWAKYSGKRSEFSAVLVAPHGRDGLVLLHRGWPRKTLALHRSG